MDVGFIGLGIMGLPMARHLTQGLPSGQPLHVYDRSAEKAAHLAQLGAVAADSGRAVARECGVVIFMVPEIAHVRAALEGPDGVLAGVRGPITLVVSSTCSPQDVRDLQADLAAVDPRIRVVDAPVSGGQEGAEEGTLSIMVGGEVAEVEPVLAVMASAGRVEHLGPLGAGQVAKACNQLIVAAEVVALAEASLLAERAGLDVAKLFDLLSTSYAASRILDVKARRFVERDHTASGPAKFLVKDLRAVLEEADRSGLQLVTTLPLFAAYSGLTADGLGDLDSSVVQRWIESRSAATEG